MRSPRITTTSPPETRTMNTRSSEDAPSFSVSVADGLLKTTVILTMTRSRQNLSRRRSTDS